MELGDRRMNSLWKPNSIPCFTAHGLAKFRKKNYVCVDWQVTKILKSDIYPKMS